MRGNGGSDSEPRQNESFGTRFPGTQSRLHADTPGDRALADLAAEAFAMILEAAPLSVRPGTEAQFEAAFRKAQAIIASMPGYVSHELQRCLERPSEYILLVRWRTLEAHVAGFRGSPQYDDWKRLLHAFYDPFPVVSHYRLVEGCGPLRPAPASER